MIWLQNEISELKNKKQDMIFKIELSESELIRKTLDEYKNLFWALIDANPSLFYKEKMEELTLGYSDLLILEAKKRFTLIAPAKNDFLEINIHIYDLIFSDYEKTIWQMFNQDYSKPHKNDKKETFRMFDIFQTARKVTKFCYNLEDNLTGIEVRIELPNLNGKTSLSKLLKLTITKGNSWISFDLQEFPEIFNHFSTESDFQTP